MCMFTLPFIASPFLLDPSSAPTEVNRIPPKNYSENFVYKPNKLRLLRTK